jgi:uncharacterized protein YdiU (UPF0061 family)
LPLLSDDREAAIAAANEALGAFPSVFEMRFHAGLRQKLGLTTAQEGDWALARDLLELMAENRADFTLTFRHLSAAAGSGLDDGLRRQFSAASAFDVWETRWLHRLAEEPIAPAARRTAMEAVNPAFIPRNHRVEAVIRAAVDRNDFAPLEELLTVLSQPYRDQPAFAHYAEGPQENERVHQTFCGT